MLRVLVGYVRQPDQESQRLELLVRACSGLEFAGALDVARPHAAPDGDVLIAYGSDVDAPNLAELADLPVPVVLLMPASDAAGITGALRLGIRGIISPDATADEVESAVRAVWAGFTVTAPQVLQAILPLAESVTPEPFAEELAESLSERECEVLELLAEGLPNKLIAVGLSISEHTVKTHVGSIFAKLGVSSRTEAVSQAIRRGLLML